MKELSFEEIDMVDGASAEGASVVMTSIVLGAAIGSVVPGVGTGVGAVAGAISGGIHALIIWNAVN